MKGKYYPKTIIFESNVKASIILKPLGCGKVYITLKYAGKFCLETGGRW